MNTGKQLILSHSRIEQILERMAFQIVEQNLKESSLYLVGVWDKGYDLASILGGKLKKVSPLDVHLIKLEVDKIAPTQSEVILDRDRSELKDKVVILVDDVLNSGKTLAYSLRPFLSVDVRKIQVAVLVDRGYNRFPVKADYVGYTLSTTLKEHILVDMYNPNDISVFLQ